MMSLCVVARECAVVTNDDAIVRVYMKDGVLTMTMMGQLIVTCHDLLPYKILQRTDRERTNVLVDSSLVMARMNDNH